MNIASYCRAELDQTRLSEQYNKGSDGVSWNYHSNVSDAGELFCSFLQLLSNETNREAWTGLSDKMEEGEFVWTDGSTPEYTNWAAEQPNDEDDQQDCAEIANGVFWPGGLPQIGVWNDFQCKRALMFICEKDE
ncbi:alpha-N-acetylgalactosamine-specific lectin-like isoform X3 [Stylophora pistillata]|uniref:alpha-N-acetylgalactosamine-specific lectin-like isoform X3 n=1 Tax=Stylophora pistillata TaxID=50429 RepID=UPI000C04205D|nr:alpha-N-acetylgalactosamine-specific lectin-like isoform X3 [Stylophora pistillata]